MDVTDSYSPIRKVPIADIKIDENHPGQERYSEKDTADLAASIQENGLIHPITLTSDWGLVSGLNRVRAHKLLGLDLIDARIRKGAAEDDYELHPAVIRSMQYAENVSRKAMKATEAADLARQIKELKGLTKAEAQARAAEISGISARTQQRVEAIERAAESDDPEVAAAAKEALVDMEAGGSVGGAEAKVKAAQQPVDEPEYGGEEGVEFTPAVEGIPSTDLTRDEDYTPVDDSRFDGGVNADDGTWDATLADGPEEPGDPGAGLVDDQGLPVVNHDTDAAVTPFPDEMPKDVKTALIGLLKVAEQSDSIVTLETKDLLDGIGRLTPRQLGELRDLLETLNGAMIDFAARRSAA